MKEGHCGNNTACSLLNVEYLTQIQRKEKNKKTLWETVFNSLIFLSFWYFNTVDCIMLIKPDFDLGNPSICKP